MAAALEEEPDVAAGEVVGGYKVTNTGELYITLSTI